MNDEAHSGALLTALRNPTRLLAAALIATPLLWVAAEIASPTLKPDSAAQLDVIAAHPNRWYWYTFLLVAGSITWVPAVLAVAKAAAGRSAALAWAGAGLLGFSAIVAVADAMAQFMTWQMADRSANRTQMVALLDRYDNSTGANIFFAAGGIAMLVGTGLLSAALSRSCPVWVAATFAIGIVVDLAGFVGSSVPLIAAGAVVLVPPGIYLARRLLALPTTVATSGTPSPDADFLSSSPQQ